MKQNSILIGCYALLNLVGGLIGYFVAHSTASLVASSIIASLLLVCSALIWKQNVKSLYVATSIIFSVGVFFAYRYFLTYKFAPAGIMAVISAGLFLYLVLARMKCRKVVNCN